MVVRIIIAGESKCELFAQACLVADYLKQNLPMFCCDRIEKSVKEWKKWLNNINQKNKWHHTSSPLIWKELLMKGSKSYYIGGVPEFWDYCYSYYNFDAFLSKEKYEGLVQNIDQLKRKIKEESENLKTDKLIVEEQPSKKEKLTICISGAGFPLTMHLLSGLLEMAVGNVYISKIYIYDSECSSAFMEFIERECSFVSTTSPLRVVKHVKKLGIALTNSDLLIVMDHVPFDMDAPIGDWLSVNKKLMWSISDVINAAASPKMRILLPNLGPACYNATVLIDAITNGCRNNVVVATSDLGLEIASVAAKIAEVPLKNMFCPPVWGFVGINHLVDINTTIHRYDCFEPYRRYTRVGESTLTIGALSPELRTMQYLMYRDEKLWKIVSDKKMLSKENQTPLNKAIAVLIIVKMWLFTKNSEDIVSLGVRCDGSFDLKFEGVFSQPARLVNGHWKPVGDYLRPKDPFMKLAYLDKMAEFTYNLRKKSLPKIIPYYPCFCKPRFYNKKQVWFMPQPKTASTRSETADESTRSSRQKPPS